MPVDKFFVNLERYGNTSAASIPIALTEAIRAGRVKPGDRMVMVGFGAGLTWAAAALEWGVPIPTRPLPWWRRVFSPVLWFFAGLRSASIRTERHVYNQIMGPVGKDDWRPNAIPTPYGSGCAWLKDSCYAGRIANPPYNPAPFLTLPHPMLQSPLPLWPHCGGSLLSCDRRPLTDGKTFMFEPPRSAFVHAEMLS